MKIIFIMILLIHGLIHLMGFSKAFDYGNITQLTKEISKPMGLLWLIAALLFVTVTILWLLKKEDWWIIGMIAIIISQLLNFQQLARCKIWNHCQCNYSRCSDIKLGEHQF